MPRLDSDQRLIPSVLDRLIDLEPDHVIDVPASRFQRLRDLKASLCRDLAALFNTKRGEDDLLAQYEGSQKSLLSFGIPDFTLFNLRSREDQAKLARAIERAIRQFEPRLIHATVRLREPDEREHTLYYRVEALLRVHPQPEPVQFDTYVHPADRRFVVVGDGA